jgi:hypothetical protein
MFAGGGHDGPTLQAYKLAYVWKFGPVPKGMMLDHICRNKKCVNPDHVRPVTPAQNVTENSESLAARNKAKTRCPKGHAYSGKNSAGGRICKICNAATRAKYIARKGVRRAL